QRDLPAEGGIVATRAVHVLIAAEARVEVERLAQRGLLGCVRIGCRKRDVEWATELRLHRCLVRLCARRQATGKYKGHRKHRPPSNHHESPENYVYNERGTWIFDDRIFKFRKARSPLN